METLYERLMRGVVRALGKSPEETQRSFMQSLKETDPEMAAEIEKRIFVIDDLALMDDRSIQKILRELEMEDLAKALKGVAQEVQDKVFRNMSKRAATLLKEDMGYMGPVRVKDVNEAQQKIVSVFRKLEERGEIVVARSPEDEMIV